MARSRRKSPESSDNLARKIWLAGLGAYGKSVEDAQDQLDKASHEASKLFRDLVNKGQGIESHSRDAFKEKISEARGRLSEARERISEAAGNNSRSVEDMVSRVRSKLGFHDAEAHARIDVLTRQVNALKRALARQGEDKAAPAKPRAAGASKRKTR